MDQLTAEERKAKMDELWVEHDFFESHLKEFRKEYPDRWIAVCNYRVIASAADLEGVCQELERIGLKPTQVWMKFITAKSMVWFL